MASVVFPIQHMPCIALHAVITIPRHNHLCLIYSVIPVHVSLSLSLSLLLAKGNGAGSDRRSQPAHRRTGGRARSFKSHPKRGVVREEPIRPSGCRAPEQNTSAESAGSCGVGVSELGRRRLEARGRSNNHQPFPCSSAVRSLRNAIVQQWSYSRPTITNRRCFRDEGGGDEHAGRCRGRRDC